MRHWDPLYEHFENQLTCMFSPIRTVYKDTALGANIRYVVELTFEDGSNQVIPLRESEYQVRIFRAFSLTRESLTTKESLEKFLQLQIDEGKLKCKTIKVFDLQEWRDLIHEDYKREVIEAEYKSRFQYYVVGKIHTKFLLWKTAKENKKRNQKTTRKQAT